ncbi:X2-like carbohydrate binding domain-containing protein [Paenibacillus sp. TAB 01]|uniref:X2-like carbohydrate binding domain-containing protein n=1 Tax=Paenibacillus sp. TAB 01 TaxID=3368988 RepID=UPI00375003D2
MLMSLLIAVSGWGPFPFTEQKAYANSGDVDFNTAVITDLTGSFKSVHSAVALPGGKTGYVYSDSGGGTYYTLLDKTGTEIPGTTVALDSEMGTAAGSPGGMKVIYLNNGSVLIAWDKLGDGNSFIVLNSSLSITTHKTAIGDPVADTNAELTDAVQLSDGNIVFMWYVADNHAYYTTIFKPDGTSVVGKATISDQRDQAESTPSQYAIATNHNGTYMIVSRHFKTDITPAMAYDYDRAVLYNNNGTVKKNLFNLNTSGNTTSMNFPISVIGLSNHNYAALYVDGDNAIIQEFDNNGATVGSIVNPAYVSADFTAGLLESEADHFIFYRIDQNGAMDAAEVDNNGNSISSYSPVINNDNDFIVGGQIVFSGFENHIGVYHDNFSSQTFILHGVASAVAPSSTISPTTASFDKNVADTTTGHYADITTTLAFNGNTLMDITLNGSSIDSGNFNELSGMVTIKKEYLATLGPGEKVFTLDMSEGTDPTLTVIINDTTPLNSTISPTTATFDKNIADTTPGHYTDVTTTVILNGNLLSSILNGVSPLNAITDYTVSGSRVTIKKEYLAAQTVSPVTLIFNFSAGATQTLTITVNDTTPGNSTISPTTATFDKNMANTSTGQYADVSTMVSFNGNTLSSIVNGTSPLSRGTDYMVTGTTVSSDVYISKAYLAEQKIGTTVLTFNFSAGASQTLTIAVSDTTGPAAPMAPTVQLVSTSSQGVIISWTAVSGATSYKIFKSSISASYGEEVDTVDGSTLSYSTGNLTKNTTYYFVVKASGAGGDSPASNEIVVITKGSSRSGSHSTASGTPMPESTNIAQALVNGKAQDAGTVATETNGSKSVTTVTLDPQKLDEKLAAEGQHAIVTIPFNTKSDTIVGELNGQMVRNMEIKEAILEIKTDNATYRLPAQQINIRALSDKLGTGVQLQDITVHIEITKPAENMMEIIKDSAARYNLKLVADPLDFNITGIYNGNTIGVSQFNAYLERTISIPEGVNPQQITTGVVIDPDGALRHVPTKVEKDSNGKYIAKINSLTNSTYSVVWHPLEFKDAAQHWAKDAINDMGSRLIITGIETDLFRPDQDITRAEFAAILVRGLGLKPEAGGSTFTDVKPTDWYNSVVETAYAYKLISGFEDGSFRPQDKITREQAMTMIAKAMLLTDLHTEASVVNMLDGFQDGSNVSVWAKNSVVECLQAGIVSGRSSTEFAPKAFISRAEVAVLVQRLLQKSNLI